MDISLELVHKDNLADSEKCQVCHAVREETLWIAVVDGSLYGACNRHIGELLNDWIAPMLRIKVNA